jgi:hypothetical protein
VRLIATVEAGALESHRDAKGRTAQDHLAYLDSLSAGEDGGLPSDQESEVWDW